jgi:sulfate transport system ATP-binding protein
MDASYVELKHINKHYNDYQASHDISFTIEKGKLIALLGPSGSGKTTILRMIAGLETPDSGDIIIDGKKVNDLRPSQRGIGFVFQNYALFRYMTVYDNIAFGLKVAKKSRREIDKRVNELLKLVGLEGLGKRYPYELSGGQRQRVAFARALAPSPELLLLDEPFAAIDAIVRIELRTWLKEMIRRVGITSIFVTHDQEEAIEVADEIIVTNHGHIEQKGTPIDIYKTPRSPFVAEFIGHPTRMRSPQRLKGFETVKAQSAILRHENIAIYKKEDYIKYIHAVEDGVVKNRLFLGKEVEYTIEVKGMEILGTRSIEEAMLEVGEDVKVLIYRLFIKREDGELAVICNPNISTDESVVI